MKYSCQIVDAGLFGAHISEEYSDEYNDGMELYYPVNNVKNNGLADSYRALAQKSRMLYLVDEMLNIGIKIWHR